MAVGTQAGIFSVGSLTNQIRQGSDIDIKAAEALDSMSNSGNALLARIAVLEAAAANPSPAAIVPQSLVTLVILTAATTLMTYPTPVTAGDSLSFGILQDSTGSRQITWDTNLLGAPVGIDSTADTLNLFLFVARTNPVGGLLTWFLNGVPNLGVVI